MNKKKINQIVLIVLGVLILTIGIIGITMLIEYNRSGLGDGEAVTIEIESGEGTLAIADKLKEAGLINYRIIFYLKAKDMGAIGKLPFGTFTLYKGSGLDTIIDNMVHGGALKEQRMLTISEGYTIEMIAKKVEKEGICSEADFLEAAKQEYDYWFLETVPEDAEVFYRLQGFLYPETYAIAEDMTAKDVVKVMLEQFDKTFTQEMKQKAEDLGKTVYEVVIEASIIERETAVDSERVTVAGVIKNRLEMGKKLEIDPTFLYPLTNGLYDIDNATYEHTRYDSPYNTYKNTGLPVGPIANPGLASLEAALNPEEHDFLYYHTDKTKNDGSHIFTKNYQDHINTQ